MIILHEQGQIVRVPKQRPLDRQLLNLIRPGDVENLCRRQVRGAGEIEIIFIEEEFEGLWGRGRVGSAEEDGVKFEHTGEAIDQK